jgi:hypothetical protein
MIRNWTRPDSETACTTRQRDDGFAQLSADVAVNHRPVVDRLCGVTSADCFTTTIAAADENYAADIGANTSLIAADIGAHTAADRNAACAQ